VQKVKKAVLPLLVVFMLSGCMNIEKRVLDDIQLATALGYEYIDKDTFETTVVFPNFQPDKSVKNETITAKSVLTREIRDLQSLQSDKPFVSGKIEVTLFERKTAERGLANLLDALQRDPSVGAKVYLGILEGSPRDFLSKQYGNADNGIYLSNLIEQNIESGLIHKTNLHQFMYKLYAEGIDPVLPILEQKEGNANLKALGLFKNDKLVDEIKPEQFFIFKILLERRSQRDSYAIQFKNKGKASIYNIKATRKFEIPKPMTSSDINMNIKIRSILLEYQNGSLSKAKMTMLEKEMEKEFKKAAEDMIKKFQEKGIDPLGIGEQVRTRSRNWDMNKWKDIYPTIKLNVNVDVELLESGVIQ